MITEGLNQSGGMYASHPATIDRIAAADQEPASGVFGGMDAPAQTLFHDYSKLCCDATLSWYTDQSGLAVQKSNLVPTSDLVAAYEREVAATNAAERIIGKLWSGAALFAPMDPPEAVADQDALIKEAEAVEERMIEARRTKALVAAGIEHQSGVSNGVQSAQEQRVAVRSRLGRAAAAAMRRLDQVQGEEGDRLRACLTMLAAQQSHLDAVRDGFLVLAAVLEHRQGNQQNENFIHQLRLEMNGQRTHLIRLRDACMGHLYPFDHYQKDITIGNYLLTVAPPPEDLGQIMDGSQQILRNLYALHQRALSRLATLANAAST